MTAYGNCPNTLTADTRHTTLTAWSMQRATTLARTTCGIGRRRFQEGLNGTLSKRTRRKARRERKLIARIMERVKYHANA